VAISSLIKVQTGLVDAQAESYLKQSEEIFGQAEIKTEGLTRPESFIRARALKLQCSTHSLGSRWTCRPLPWPTRPPP